MRNFIAPASLFFVGLTVLLGGSSFQGILGNALLQLLAIAMIGAVAMSGGPRAEGSPKSPRLTWVIGAAALLVVAQFFPLPRAIWTTLPGREEIAKGFKLLAVSPAWQTLSMSPWATLASITWCLPAIASFLIAKSPRGPSFRAVAILITVLACASLAVGIAQILSGASYTYAVTNYGAPVGFFSNGNHQADFLVCALLFFATQISRAPGDTSHVMTRYGRTIFFYGVGLYLSIGVILCGSLAGSGLLIIALGGTVLMLHSKWRPSKAFLVVLLVISFAGAFAYALLAPASADFTLDTTQPGMSRTDFWRTGLKMLAAYAPFGSGLGTFEELYHLFENPDIVDRTYVNHAHNDYLELLIETGVFGLLLLSAFFIWVARRLAYLPRQNRSVASYACGMVVLVLALHSLVDYPLRTAAMSSVLGLAIGFLAREGDSERPRRRSGMQNGSPPSLIEPKL